MNNSFSTIDGIVAAANEQKASDIHLVFGRVVHFRVNGSLAPAGGAPLSHEDCEGFARELAGEDFSTLMSVGEIDLAKTIAGVRVRINLFKQQGHVSGAIRLLSNTIPNIEVLGLPPAVQALTELPRGIVLVTGETGSGKSTTLAAMLDKINKTHNNHILTLEDPVEYVYTSDKSTINQREIGRDTQSFAHGLRAALREDPDVILIGEMRDLETIETALSAAETGHLVFATLHTNSAADSVDRVVDVFPEGRHQQIRMQLSMTLKAVVSQQLIPKADGTGRALACEVMLVNSAIKNLIREGKTPMIFNALSTSAKEGNISMDNSLIQLARANTITPEAALDAAHDPDYVKQSIGSARTSADYGARSQPQAGPFTR